MRKQKSCARVAAVFVLTLSLFAAWLALPNKYQRWLEPTAFAAAKVFTVNVNGDGHDANPGDGICETSISGNCSLRAAIEEANANSGADTINFNIPGAGVHTISPASPLPNITESVVINGYSQSGASINNSLANSGDNAVLLIQLQGSNAGSSASGLTVVAGSTTIQGLVINSFSTGSAISVSGSASSTIQGNFLGTNPDGTAVLGNFDGVVIGSSGTSTIGGLDASARNIISGNQVGIDILSGNGNLVQNNFIGTNANGNAALPNNSAYDCGAVRVTGDADNTTIGGLGQARNVISGNGKHGVQIVAVATHTKVQGNFIGTGILGNPLGNGGSGVLINGTVGSTIGGSADAGNTIAFNGANGVTVLVSADNAILSNRIFSNGKLGIDLNDDGVTPNDAGDTNVRSSRLLSTAPALANHKQSRSEIELVR
jgi:CSLREA domain-containing protein